METFQEICHNEKITIPHTEESNKRIQRYSPIESVEFELDEESIKLLKDNLWFDNMNFTFMKKMAENIIILNRLKHRGNNISRLELISKSDYHYLDKSFDYKPYEEKKDTEVN